MFNKNYKAGFTLAEVLVTLGIIGIVAVVTMPTIVTNVQKKSFVTQLHKVYSDVSNVMKKYLSDEKVENLSETDLYAGITSDQSFFKQYFNIAKDCGTGTGCFATSYSALANENMTFFPNTATGYYKVILSSGASLGLRKNTGSNYSTLIVDVNGLKGPNKSGRDLFMMYIYHDDPIAPRGVNADYCQRPNLLPQYLYCFAKIVEDGWEMNY